MRDATAPDSSPRLDDMADTAEELAALPASLREAVAACEGLHQCYERADREALRHQRHHRLLTAITSVCGTAAVLFAIVQLSRLIDLSLLLEVEFVAAAVALVAVALGLAASRQGRWLLERHKAERCRLLKFRFLTDTRLWASPATRALRIQELGRELSQLEQLSTKELHHWVEEDAIPAPPSGSPSDAAAGSEVLRGLVAYYGRKRLAVQIGYFERRARQNLRVDRPMKHLPMVFFFASVLAAFAHFAYDVATKHTGSHEFSAALIVLAAALPVLGSGVRTLRMSQEFARNTSRYRAKLVVLKRLAESLAAETEPEMIFRELWCGEQVLESEHREWLRLMVEAEWFG